MRYAPETVYRNLANSDTLDAHEEGTVPCARRPARKADWVEFVPAMRSKVMRFKVVNEGEWQA